MAKRNAETAVHPYRIRTPAEELRDGAAGAYHTA